MAPSLPVFQHFARRIHELFEFSVMPNGARTIVECVGGLAFAVITGMLLSQTLKWGFARPRPDLVPALAKVYSQSFPSGHAMVSAVVYLTLGVLLVRTPIRTAIKAYLLFVATLLTLIVGVSRVYLGVHWPSDVLAGWAGGAAWALLCWLAMLWLQSRGKVATSTLRADRR